MTLPDIYVPAGSSGHGNFTVDIDPQRAGWAFSGLRVLVLEAGASVTLAELRKWAEKSLAHYALPRQIVVMSELPRSQLGKVMRKKVREQIMGAQASATEAVAGAREAMSEAMAGARDTMSEKVAVARESMSEAMAGARESVAEASSEAMRRLTTTTSDRTNQDEK